MRNTQKKWQPCQNSSLFCCLPWPESYHISVWASPVFLIKPSVVQTVQSPHNHSLTVPSSGDIHTTCFPSTTRSFNRTNALSLWYSQKAEREENRSVLFFPYVAFFHLFLCRLSLVYRHIVRFANCLFPPPLSCVFQQFFLPVLSTLPFQFFILTFLGEYPRFPMDSGTDLKSILTKGNLSISAVDRNRISRTGGWHIWCLLPQHRTLTGIWQLCPICWFLSLQRYSSFVGLVCVS